MKFVLLETLTTYAIYVHAIARHFNLCNFAFLSLPKPFHRSVDSNSQIGSLIRLTESN